MINVKSLSTFLIDENGKELVVFYDDENEKIFCLSEINEDFKKSIILSLKAKFPKYDPADVKIDFSNLEKITNMANSYQEKRNINVN